MTDATLQTFRDLADVLAGPAPRDWQWIGPHMSQRMFGITQERAEGYAKRHGGEAGRMKGYTDALAPRSSRSILGERVELDEDLTALVDFLRR